MKPSPPRRPPLCASSASRSAETLRALLLSALVLGLLPGSAAAESDAGACNPSLIYPAPGTIPANLPGFYLLRNDNDVGNARLFLQEAGGAEREIPVTIAEVDGRREDNAAVTIVPDEPLVPGATYQLDRGACFISRTPTIEYPRVVYQVGDALPPPTTLGTVALSEVRRFVPPSGDASYRFDATLTPSAEVAPWIALYEIAVTAETPAETTAFGSRLGGYEHALTQQLQLQCGSGGFRQVAPGPITVEFFATPFFGGDSLSASASTTTSCDDFVDVTPPRDDAGVDMSTDPPDGGGECAASPGARGPVALALLPLVAALALTLRRRR